MVGRVEVTDSPRRRCRGLGAYSTCFWMSDLRSVSALTSLELVLSTEQPIRRGIITLVRRLVIDSGYEYVDMLGCAGKFPR